jgi:two-component system, sporulation sensor kinase C
MTHKTPTEPTRQELIAELERLRARVAELEASPRNGTPAITDPIVDGAPQPDATLRLLLEQVPAIVWSTDTAFRLTLSIGAGLANLGLRPNQVVGQTIFEFLHTTDEYHPAINAHIRCLQGIPSSWETQVQGRTFESHSDPLRNAAGEIIGVIGVALDVTERTNVATALRESENRYRALAENSLVGICQLDMDGNVQYANPALCKSLEVDRPEELLGKSHQTFFTPEGLKKVTAELALRRKGNISHYEAEMIGRRGTAHPVLISGAPVRDENGVVYGMIASFTDISALKEAERKLRESTELFHTVSRVAPVGIILTDALGRCSFANERWCHYCGVSPDQYAGVEWAVALHPDDRIVVETEWESALRENRPFRCEIRLIANGVTRWMICEAAGAYDDAGNAKYYVGAVTDITERRTAEEALRHTENLAATGRMAAHVAHEINNPLAGIKNSFLLIKDAVPASHPYFSYVGRIEKEVDRIARIVAQMLDMYRPHQETPREFKISEAILDVVAFLETSAKERELQIIPRLPEAHHSVVLPESWLRQVLYNVLQNAIESSPRHAPIEIDVALGRQLQIQIADRGPGIPASAAFRIFEPFFTTKAGSGNRGGLGLGLSTSRSLVEAMHGTITFENRPKGGTTFRISLPLKSEAP